MKKIEIDKRYSADQLNFEDLEKNLIFGLKTSTGENSKFRSIIRVTLYE